MSHDGEAPRTDHLRPWGCVCYVHEESTRSFGAKARKAYLLGLSDNHADGVYEVLMADTLTVRHSMNVVFHQMPDVSPPDMPTNKLLFNLRPLAPIAVPDPDSPSVDVGDGMRIISVPERRRRRVRGRVGGRKDQWPGHTVVC